MADDTAMTESSKDAPQATARALADEWEKVWGSPDTSLLGERARRTIAFLRSLSTCEHEWYLRDGSNYCRRCGLVQPVLRPPSDEAAELRRLAERIQGYRDRNAPERPTSLLDDAEDLLRQAAARLDALEGAVANHDEHAALLTRRIEQEHASFVAELNRKEAAERRAERYQAALLEIAEERDAGRHDGKREPCPVHDADTMFALARAALAATPRQPEEQPEDDPVSDAWAHFNRER